MSGVKMSTLDGKDKSEATTAVQGMRGLEASVDQIQYPHMNEDHRH